MTSTSMHNSGFGELLSDYDGGITNKNCIGYILCVPEKWRAAGGKRVLAEANGIMH